MTNHEEIGRSIGALVAEKNAAYGDSFKNSGEIMKFLFPKGIPPEKYQISLALVRILDKIFRIATNPGYNNEDPWKDIAGYCILMAGYEQQRGNFSLDNASEQPVCFSGTLPLRVPVPYRLDDISLVDQGGIPPNLNSYALNDAVNAMRIKFGSPKALSRLEGFYSFGDKEALWEIKEPFSGVACAQGGPKQIDEWTRDHYAALNDAGIL